MSIFSSYGGFRIIFPRASQSLRSLCNCVASSCLASDFAAVELHLLHRSLISRRLSSTAFASLSEDVSLQSLKLEMQNNICSG